MVLADTPVVDAHRGCNAAGVTESVARDQAAPEADAAALRQHPRWRTRFGWRRRRKGCVDADAASWQRAAWTSANQEFNEVQNLGEDGLIRTCSARRNPALAEKLYQATRKNNLAASKRAC